MFLFDPSACCRRFFFLIVVHLTFQWPNRNQPTHKNNHTSLTLVLFCGPILLMMYAFLSYLMFFFSFDPPLLLMNRVLLNNGCMFSLTNPSIGANLIIWPNLVEKLH
ncbi:hypothetical protein Hanom_Chr06g00524071 [Helianthus anomalus]